MVCNVRIQPTAVKELEGIVSYLTVFISQAAEEFLNKWEQMLEELRDGMVEHRFSRFPVLARLGYHTIIIGDYIVLYFKDGNAVVIARIFHQSQDYANIVVG